MFVGYYKKSTRVECKWKRSCCSKLWVRLRF